MNRTSHLKQQYHVLLKQKRSGAPATKKSYYYVMRKVLNTLQKLRCLPKNWRELNDDTVKRLINYWQQQGDKSNTIKNRLSVLRQLIDSHTISENKLFSLNVSKVKSKVKFQSFDIKKIDNPLLVTIIEFEINFGLTKLESMLWSTNDGLEVDNSRLIIDRNISHNKKRREVPVINDKQVFAITHRRDLLGNHDKLLSLHSFATLLTYYGASLSLLDIKSEFRDYYINQRYQQLLQEQNANMVFKQLMRELGFADKRSIKNHLWST